MIPLDYVPTVGWWPALLWPFRYSPRSPPLWWTWELCGELCLNVSVENSTDIAPSLTLWGWSSLPRPIQLSRLVLSWLTLSVGVSEGPGCSVFLHWNDQGYHCRTVTDWFKLVLFYKNIRAAGHSSLHFVCFSSPCRCSGFTTCWSNGSDALYFFFFFFQIWLLAALIEAIIFSFHPYLACRMTKAMVLDVGMGWLWSCSTKTVSSGRICIHTCSACRSPLLRVCLPRHSLLIVPLGQ